MPSPSVITAGYRARLGSVTSGSLQLTRGAVAELYDPAAPMSSLKAAGAASSSVTAGAQLAAVTEAQGYLVALTSSAHGVPVSAVAPFRLPEGLVGSSAAGVPLADITGLAPLVYWRRVGLDLDSPEGLAAATHWLERVAASEPMRAANATVLDAVGRDPRLGGRYRRETAPGACQFCSDIADRGYIPWAAGLTFAAHGNLLPLHRWAHDQPGSPV